MHFATNFYSALTAGLPVSLSSSIAVLSATSTFVLSDALAVEWVSTGFSFFSESFVPLELDATKGALGPNELLSFFPVVKWGLECKQRRGDGMSWYVFAVE